MSTHLGLTNNENIVPVASLALSDRNFSKAEQRQRQQQQQHVERKVNEMKRRTVVGEAVRRSASSPSLPPSLPRRRLSRHLPLLRPSFLISPAAPYARASREEKRRQIVREGRSRRRRRGRGEMLSERTNERTNGGLPLGGPFERGHSRHSLPLSPS